MGAQDPTHGVAGLSLYLLDTNVLIDHLRGDEDIKGQLLELLAAGHSLCTCCVSVAEIRRGVVPREEKPATDLLNRLHFLDTGRDAAARAGAYQAQFAKRGRTIHTADALIAGTARSHGAVILTSNLGDFPMRDVRVVAPAVDG
ncbi:MAG: hypothetical protein QOJ38_1206 [Solirubrobacterales bacterium]|nr:hypothetical protein [Solirubrobacterales bacterium]